MRQPFQHSAFKWGGSYLITLCFLLAGNAEAVLKSCHRHPHPIPYFMHQHDICPACSIKPDKQVLDIQSQKWNKAALQMFSKLTGNSPKNHIISPHSINEILTMLAVGADGKTLETTTKIMGTTPGELPFLSELLHVEEDDVPLQMDEVDAFSRYNAILVSGQYKLSDSYTSYLRHHFDEQADIHADQDFSDRLAVSELAKSVNNKVCEVTRNKIRDCVDADNIVEQKPALYLANATYFAGKWDVEFERSKGTFLPLSGPEMQVSMISSDSFKKVKLGEYDGWQIASIPYKGRFEMVVFLPPGGVAPGTLTHEQFVALSSDLHYDEEDVITVKMPEYMFEMTYDLTHVLATSEPGDMFSANASFGEMLKSQGHQFRVSSISHKAIISTDKDGTIVAAETRCCATDGGDKCILLDHPFMFMINDKKHKAIRFIGQIHKPEKPQPAQP